MPAKYPDGKALLLNSACMQDGAYWLSWAITHWTTWAVSGVLCTLVSIWPFPASDPTVLLAFLWLAAAALIAFAYALSTLFSTSRVAGMVAVFSYTLAVSPG